MGVNRRRPLPVAIRIVVSKVGVTSKRDELKPYIQFSENEVCQSNLAPCLGSPCMAHRYAPSLKGVWLVSFSVLGLLLMYEKAIRTKKRQKLWRDSDVVKRGE